MALYAVKLYTQVSIEVFVQAGSEEDAVQTARELASDDLTFELIDETEAVGDWGVETGDWEFLEVERI